MGKGIRRTPEQIIRKLRQAEILSGQGRTVDQICRELGVSDATATNYLEELEKEGKIKQHGDTGRGVFYTPK